MRKSSRIAGVSVSFLALVLVAVVSFSHHPQVLAEAMTASSSDVVVSATADKEVYAPGEPVKVTVNLTNTGVESITLHFPGPGIYYVVTTALDDRTVYDYYGHATWLWAFWDRTLIPGEVWSTSFDLDYSWWNQEYDDGSPVPWPADYHIWGGAACSEALTRVSTVISIENEEPMPGGGSGWIYGLHTNKLIYAPEEAVDITLYVRNTNNVTMNLTFSAYPLVYFTVHAQNGTAVVPSPRAFLDVETTFVLKPRQAIAWDFSWHQTWRSGGQVPWPAFYRISIGTTGNLPEPESEWIALTDSNHSRAEFVYIPQKPLQNTSITFNASSSNNSVGGQNDVQYRWDWNGDGVWDTDWSSQSTVNHTYPTPGDYVVKLNVRDLIGAISETEAQVTVWSERSSDISEFIIIGFLAAISVAAIVIVAIVRKRIL